MKKATFRRALAYIIDILIIGFIATAFSSIKFINPKYEEYKNAYTEYEKYVQELSMSNPTKVFNDEKAQLMSYDVSLLGVYSSIITLVITFLYFGIFQYYTKGKTVGKIVTGIQVISTDGDRLKLSQVILRSGIIDSLLTSSLLIIAILFLNQNNYSNVSTVIEILDFGLIVACIGMMVYREDGVGLHDYLAHTRVVIKSEYDEIKEAEYTEKENSKKEEKIEEITINKEEKPKLTTKKKKTTKSKNKKVTKKEDE